MKIRFNFDHLKAIQVMAYLIGKLKRVEKVKLVKLLYIADRSHFLEYGCPITKDRQCAMDYGPLPSTCLDMINGYTYSEDTFKVLHVSDHTVSLKNKCDTNLLLEEEKETLDEVLKLYGDLGPFDLVKKTHEFGEYSDNYRKGTSKNISYEDILRFSGSEKHFRKGRCVLSENTLAEMICPFDDSDVDL